MDPLTTLPLKMTAARFALLATASSRTAGFKQHDIRLIPDIEACLDPVLV